MPHAVVSNAMMIPACLRHRCLFWFLLLGFSVLGEPTRADVVELLSGSKIEGQVTKIDRDAREITVTHTMAGRAFTRIYPYDRIHAITMNDKRYVLNEMQAEAAGATNKPSTSSGSKSPVGVSSAASRDIAASKGRSAAEVQALIDQQGSTPPDWYDATPLNYPATLDLTWPEPVYGPWNAQRNMGQYIWDVLNPNPGKWKEGTKLLHHLLEVNKDKPQTVQRIMDTLGRFYHNLLEDYARAAFWWQKAGVHKPNSRFPGSVPLLAECYYRLGNKPMAVELLRQLEKTSGQFALIKAWADMGEPQHAIELAEGYARAAPPLAAICYMYAGDACRTNGLYDRAIQYYEKALKSPAIGQQAKRIERERLRAAASLEAIRLFELAEVTKVPDGVYEASSLGYAGPLYVAVTVRGGRMIEVKVTRHEEKQFYSALNETTAKIVQKQGVKGVDATSSATLTSEAIINATAKALAGAARAR